MNGMRHVKSGSGDHEHTKTDGLGDAALLAAGADPWRSRPRSERMAAHKIECNACPVLCQISEGKVGACDRYANSGGVLVRVDPVLLVRKAVTAGQGVDEGALIPFAALATDEAARSDEMRAGAARSILGGGIDAAVETLLTRMQGDRAFATRAGREDLLQAFALLRGDDQRLAGWRRRLAALLN